MMHAVQDLFATPAEGGDPESTVLGFRATAHPLSDAGAFPSITKTTVTANRQGDSEARNKAILVNVSLAGRGRDRCRVFAARVETQPATEARGAAGSTGAEGKTSVP